MQSLEYVYEKIISQSLFKKMILMSCYHYISGFIFNLNNIFKYSMSKKIFKSSNFYVKIILLLHSFLFRFYEKSTLFKLQLKKKKRKEKENSSPRCVPTL